MPIVEKYIQPYYKDSEKKKIFELFDQIDHQFNTIDDLSERIKTVKELLNRLQISDLEIGETQQERIIRIKTLVDDGENLAKEIKDHFKTVQSLHMEINSIRLKVYSRYTNDKTLSEILQDCLELIEQADVQDNTENADTNNLDNYSFTPDIDINRTINADFVDDVPQNPTPSPIVQFTYTIGQKVVVWYLDYFRGGFVDSDSYFKVLKAIYDKGLKVFPDGFTDQDKQSEYCIFDKEFFRVLDALNKEQADKKAFNDYELSILANTRPEIKRHILPSNPKITSTMFALGMIGTELHQMSIDDYLKENKKANDLVTFRGLDDDGLQFVFNANIAKKDEIVISFKNLENARGGGTAPSKIFGKVIEKMTLLGYYTAPNIDTAVTISVKDLIDDGLYANRTSGKRALIQAEKTFSELKVNFYNEKKGMDVDVSWFSAIGWKDKSTLLLMPNKAINWRLVGSHFAIYPIYIYKLNTHAYKLAYYIFTQARIKKSLNDDNDTIIKLSLINISRELGLPTVESIKNFKYKQNILDKIILAMKEIEDTDQESYGKDHRLVYLKLDHKKNQTPKEIIETANLVVTIKNGHGFTESYKMISDRKSNIIDSAKRKKEKAKRQAREKTDQT